MLAGIGLGGQCLAFGEDSCHSSLERGRKTAMKKVSEMEEKVTSSLHICPEAEERVE